MTADPRTEARKRALIAGAVHRGEVPRIGTLVRLPGKNGLPRPTAYRVTQIARRGGGYEVLVASTRATKRVRPVWIAAELVTPVIEHAG